MGTARTPRGTAERFGACRPRPKPCGPVRGKGRLGPEKQSRAPLNRPDIRESEPRPPLRIRTSDYKPALPPGRYPDPRDSCRRSASLPFRAKADQHHREHASSVRLSPEPPSGEPATQSHRIRERRPTLLRALIRDRLRRGSREARTVPGAGTDPREARTDSCGRHTKSPGAAVVCPASPTRARFPNAPASSGRSGARCARGGRAATTPGPRSGDGPGRAVSDGPGTRGGPTGQRPDGPLRSRPTQVAPRSMRAGPVSHGPGVQYGS